MPAPRKWLSITRNHVSKSSQKMPRTSNSFNYCSEYLSECHTIYLNIVNIVQACFHLPHQSSPAGSARHLFECPLGARTHEGSNRYPNCGIHRKNIRKSGDLHQKISKTQRQCTSIGRFAKICHVASMTLIHRCVKRHVVSGTWDIKFIQIRRENTRKHTRTHTETVQYTSRRSKVVCVPERISSVINDRARYHPPAWNKRTCKGTCPILVHVFASRAASDVKRPW